ncbi:TetR family transcriptional regulator [Variovorax sp. WS11]|uniref:TetR/AcrR family transcriptional regulator n=1 Tax=Variovorax sp. WS11 TaxID=1105204 RepID=UPI000D0CC974|nr:TetR/AcrR family transcriptional regulator [Variovorax sp. WS11]NDZ18377.1 TetR/AcrR family transcriptional regulator [Variovorax sp. WS11]PSL81674.1 TetR family transcriptional regulator [Variovorax sp. WS11]
MSSTPIPRPGGRSARVQGAVHKATRQLLDEQGRAALTVPLIAARAGVTPSTIYRRWGDLADLLADVAVERLRPDSDPLDTGTVEGDLLAWAEQFRDETSSELGRAMVRDVVSARGAEAMGDLCPCAQFAMSQLGAVVERGQARGEPVPDVETLMDRVVAPIVYRMMFGLPLASQANIRAWVKACLKDAAGQGSPATPARTRH